MKYAIAQVAAFPVRYPVAGRFKFFEGPHRRAGRYSVLIKLTADDGTVGWGESAPSPRWSYETLESVYYTITRYLTPVLIGRDPCDHEGIFRAMNQEIAASFSTGQPICKAGIDLALFDLSGRLRGQSAGARWPRPDRRRLAISYTLNPQTLDDLGPMIASGQARGYRHFNVKVAPDLDFDLEMCRQIKALAPDAFLWVDANGGYDEATALRAAAKFADLGVPVLEQPLPANRLDGYRRLRLQRALPIIMDEGIVSTVELEEFIRLQLLDGVAMKPARCGGLAECRRQIEIVQREGLLFLGSGLTDPDLALAGTLLLYGAYDLAFPAALNGCQYLAGSVLRRPFAVRDGFLEVPTGPGLGVEVDEAKLHEYLVTDI